MSAPTKEYAIGDDRSDHADTPRPSSTEDESATLLRPRESFHLQDHQATKRSAHSRLVVVSLLLSNLMTIAVGVFLLSSDPRATYHDKEPKTVVYPPHPDWFPPQIPVTKVLHGDSLYGQAPTPESVEAWNNLLPIGRGWVLIKNETALPDMPKLNQSLPEHTAYPSVFHQLHCLYSTMDAYYELLGRLGQGEEGEGEAEWRRDRPSDPGWNSEHLNHCWDYLRQTIMCNADVTLEWRQYNEPAGTGWGFQHQCKDWDAIIAWVEKYRYTNNSGILRGGGERVPIT